MIDFMLFLNPLLPCIVLCVPPWFCMVRGVRQISSITRFVPACQVAGLGLGPLIPATCPNIMN